MNLPPPSPVAPALTIPKPARVELRSPWTRFQARRALLGAFAVGVALDLASHTHMIGVAGALAMLLTIGALLFVGVAHRAASVPLGLAAALVPWLVLRASPWLIAPDFVAIGLLVLAATRAGSDQVTKWLDVCRRLGHASIAGIETLDDGPRAVVAAFKGRRGLNWKALGRGLGVGVPLAGIVLALLASGDRFFQGMLGLDGPATGLDHLFLIPFFAALWFPLVVAARRRTVADTAAAPTAVAPNRFGRIEVVTLLASVAAVEFLYVLSLVVAAIGGKEYVARTTGLTYADYARSGFFQLVAVALIVMVLLFSCLGALHRERSRLAIALALVIAASTATMAIVSVLRLLTYRDVFGLTMLRYMTTVTATWLAIAMVIIGVALLFHRVERVLIIAILISAYGTLVAVNIANPEVAVARENIGRAANAELDESYLTRLSDDAVPTLLASNRTYLVDTICARPETQDDWSWNRARAASHRARQTHCPARP
jgi:two-component system, OmpR family, sensor histidine kinase BaeS